jgi:hypothetical protein
MTEIRNSGLRWIFSLALLVTSLTIDVSSEHIFAAPPDINRDVRPILADKCFPVTVRTANTCTRLWLQSTCGDKGCHREFAIDDSTLMLA